MNNIDPKVYITYQNQWIAISPDGARILTSAPSLKEVEEKVSQQKDNDAILLYVTPPDKYLSPLCP